VIYAASSKNYFLYIWKPSKTEVVIGIYCYNLFTISVVIINFENSQDINNIWSKRAKVTSNIYITTFGFHILLLIIIILHLLNVSLRKSRFFKKSHEIKPFENYIPLKKYKELLHYSKSYKLTKPFYEIDVSAALTHYPMFLES